MDKVVHFEIPADDLSRAQKFYKQVFNWEINKSQMPGAEYYLVNTVATDQQSMPKEPGAINGGMMKRNTTVKSPVVVINVPSVDEYLKKVKVAGVWLGLFALLGFQFNTGNVVVSTGFLLFWTWRISKAQHTKSLLSHLTTIISEDPTMKRNDLDFWMLVISTGLMWVGGFLKLFFGI